MRPHRQRPSRLRRPWDCPGKNTGVSCHFLLQCRKVKSESEVTQSCLTLRNPTDCSLPGSSVHGIFQARVLEWGAIAFSKSHGKKTEKLSFCLQEPGAGYLPPETRDQATIGSVTGSKSQAGGRWKCSWLQSPDLALIPGSGRFPGEGNGNPLQ